MHRALPFLAVALVCTAFLGACDSADDPSDDLSERAAVAATYADLVYASYADSYDAATELDAAIDALVADPTEATLQAAKDAWRDAREPYGQTEAYRFANGPIDAADGPEGFLNAWPLDEAYIDYVEGDADAGIINRPDEYPTIDADLLVSLNERGGEENVAVGYHAIEFLLWGQDRSATSAGNRPVSDYTTEANAERRAQYLTVTSDLLLQHLGEMVEAWDPDVEGNYRDTFLALDADQALRNMLTGIGTLAKSELAVERIFVALNNQDQEDEHSCFSDNTHRDIITNARGIANVWRGEYVRTDGSAILGRGLADLVAEADPELAQRVDGNVAAALDAVEAIPAPFDQAIIHDRDVVIAAVDALQDLGDSFVEAANALDLEINTDLPD